VLTILAYTYSGIVRVDDMRIKTTHNTLADAMRAAIKADPRSLYELAKTAKLPYSTVHRFATMERTDLGLRTASIICEVLGLELRPAGKGG
jgi:hypothetical protein